MEHTADEAHEALTRLFRENYRPLLKYVDGRVGRILSAEDIASEAFAIACRRLAEADVNRAWLFTTARNLIGEALRRHNREGLLREALVTELSIRASTPEQDQLADAIARLSARDREILALTYWSSLEDDEIAHVLGLRASTVWKRRSRAHRRLRGLLRPTAPTSGMGGAHLALE